MSSSKLQPLIQQPMMQENHIVPYIGGKKDLIGNIVPIILDAIEEYSLEEYHELCGGGARMLLHLPIPSLRRVYNDIDAGMSALFTCCSRSELVSELIDQLVQKGVGEDVFQEAVDLRKTKTIGEDGYDLVTAAACAYIVARQSIKSMRTSFNHTLTEPKKTMKYIERIHALAWFPMILDGIEVTNESVFDILERDRDWSKSIIYLDPPYHPEAMTTNDHYGKFSWTVEDHERLVKLLLERPLGKVVLSGLDNRSYKPLVEAGWRQIPLKNMQKSSSGKPGRKQKEEVWINFGIPRELEKWVNEYVPDSE